MELLFKEIMYYMGIFIEELFLKLVDWLLDEVVLVKLIDIFRYIY